MRTLFFCALALNLALGGAAEAQRGTFTPGSDLANEDYADWADQDNAPWAAAGSSFEENNPARDRIPPWAVRMYPPEVFANPPPVIVQVPPPDVQVIESPPEIWVFEEVPAGEPPAPAAEEASPPQPEAPVGEGEPAG